MHRRCMFVIVLVSSLVDRAQSFSETLHVTSVHHVAHDDCSGSYCEAVHTVEGYIKEGGYIIDYSLTCQEVYQNNQFSFACPSVHAGHDYPVRLTEGTIEFRANDYLGGPNAKNRPLLIDLERERSKP